MTSSDASDLVPIQDAAREFSVSVASLHKYAALGRIRKYRKAFDRVTYVNRRELTELSNPATLTWFVVDIPLDQEDDLLRNLLNQLQGKFPNRAWQQAGWGSFVLINGARSAPYTALKYKAHQQRAIVAELAEAMDDVDPNGSSIDRYKVSLHVYPFETDEPTPE
jgi:hypothetical protein